MQLTPPRPMVFYIAVALAVLAVLGSFANLPLITPFAFLILLIAFAILALGVVIRDW